MESSSINSVKRISLVDRIVFSWKGNVFRRAITMADVDNDSRNELIVGSLEGNLAIFKGVDPKPWRVASNLGSISCITVGNLGNVNKNLLVVISSEGICNVYDVSEQSQQQLRDSRKNIDISNDNSVSISGDIINNNSNTNNNNNNNNPSIEFDEISETITTPNSNNTYLNTNSSNINLNGDIELVSNEKSAIIEEYSENFDQNNNGEDITDSNNEENIVEDSSTVLIPFLTQRLPPNASTILIADIDDDGQNELVIGTYDHSLFSFSFTFKDNNLNNESPPLSTQPTSQNTESLELNENTNTTTTESILTTDKDKSILTLKHKWQLPGQIGSLVLAKEFDETVLLIGLQEGTNYIILNKRGILYKEGSVKDLRTNNSSSFENNFPSDDLISSPIANSQSDNNSSLFSSPTSFFMDNRKKRTEIITNISFPLKIKKEESGSNNISGFISSSNNNSGFISNNTIILNNSTSSVDTSLSTSENNIQIVNTSGSCCATKKSNSTCESSIVCIATLEGMLKLQRIGKGIEWKMEIEEMGSGQLIALQTVNIDNNIDHDHIVACGWDGLTLIIDPDRNVVSFKYDDRVCAFHSGNYSLSKSQPDSFCLVYVTFFGEIYVYYNILSSHVEPVNTLTWLTRDQWNDFESCAKHLISTSSSQQQNQFKNSNLKNKQTPITNNKQLIKDSSLITKEFDISESYKYLLSPQFDTNMVQQYIEQLKDKLK